MGSLPRCARKQGHKLLVSTVIKLPHTKRSCWVPLLRNARNKATSSSYFRSEYLKTKKQLKIILTRNTRVKNEISFCNCIIFNSTTNCVRFAINPKRETLAKGSLFLIGTKDTTRPKHESLVLGSLPRNARKQGHKLLLFQE